MEKRSLPVALWSSLALIGISSACYKSAPGISAGVPPNIIYILADDLGYGDLGCFGQLKIETPHIDALAAGGVVFTQHYTGAPVCAPARSVLLTGLHSGKTQVRGNDEWSERGNVWNYRTMIADSTLEGQKPLQRGTYTLGSLMKDAGYRTGLVGKWGLGAPHTESIPNNLGFDYFYGYNCQRQAHTLYPVHLWENKLKIPLRNDTISPHTRLAAGSDPYDMAAYAPFMLTDYAPDLMFDALTRFVGDHAHQPFFLLWATPVPHVPLQAPQRWIDYYVNKFGEEEPYLGDKNYFPHRYPRAAYAAMVSHFDEQVGMLISQLKDMGVFDQTLIILTSDNGPTYNGGTDSPWFNSGGPFRSGYGYGKGFLHEGGIRVPMVASWPDVIAPASVSDHPSVFYDVMPTLADVAGIDVPVDTDGISFLPSLKGVPQTKHAYLYWEFPDNGGQIAVRIDNYKALLKDIHGGNHVWQLFDLDADLIEANDIADRHPDVISRVLNIVQEAHTPSDNPLWKFQFLDPG